MVRTLICWFVFHRRVIELKFMIPVCLFFADSLWFSNSSKHKDIWNIHSSSMKINRHVQSLNSKHWLQDYFRLRKCILVWWWSFWLRQWRIPSLHLNRTTWLFRPAVQWQLTQFSPTAHYLHYLSSIWWVANLVIPNSATSLCFVQKRTEIERKYEVWHG